MTIEKDEQLTKLLNFASAICAVGCHSLLVHPTSAPVFRHAGAHP